MVASERDAACDAPSGRVDKHVDERMDEHDGVNDNEECECVDEERDDEREGAVVFWQGGAVTSERFPQTLWIAVLSKALSLLRPAVS